MQLLFYFFKILEITWQLIPTILEYTLLYLYLHSEFQTNQRHTMTLSLKTKKPKNLTYATRPYSLLKCMILLKIFNILCVNKCNFQQYLLPFS